MVLALLLAAFVGWNLPRLGTAPVRTQKLDMVADGTIAIASWRGGIYTIPEEGGRPQLWVAHEPGVIIDYHSPRWLPDGSAFSPAT